MSEKRQPAEAGTTSSFNPSAPIAEIVRIAGKLRVDHHKTATRPQKAVSRMVDLLGRPMFVGLLVVVVFCWIADNSLAPTLGYVQIDPTKSTSQNAEGGRRRMIDWHREC